MPEPLMSATSIAGLIVVVMSVSLMIASAFTPKTCFFLKVKTKKKGFYAWSYVFVFTITFFLIAGLVNSSSQSGSGAPENPLAYPILICFALFLIRPIALWYWKVNSHVESAKNIIEQNKKVILLLDRIAKNSEKQSDFFERVSNRQKN